VLEPFDANGNDPSAQLLGHGEAAGGLIRAVVGADGRLTELRLDPELRRIGPGGPVVDSAAMSAQIIDAVNAALDDLETQVRNGLGGIGSRLASDLDRIAEDFERALGQVANDIVRAERRLE
jgi:DNA-binding protein YbaB